LKLNTTKNRFVVLDALRGLAALFVFMYHMPKSSFLTKNPFITSSAIFVDLFFVISGFVIYHNYGDKIKSWIEAKKFLTRRLKRLYPLHFYTLMVVLLLEVVKLLTINILPYSKIPFTGNSFEIFFTNLFLLNSTPLFQDFTWNGQSWSISAEMICYILFVFVSLYLLKNKTSALFISLIIILLSYLFFYLTFNSFDIVMYYDFSFIRAIIGFFIGVTTYIIRNHNKSKIVRKKYAGLIEILIISIIIYITCLLKTLVNYYFIYHIVFAVAIFIFSYENGFISKLLSKAVFQKLGLWSYSIYLNHIVMILVFKMLCIKLLKLDGILILGAEILLIIATCLYSKFTYKYIEKRFYKRLK
jgi:peptidoglycan/LPS O-acetylase OafA/YrhL